MSDRVYFSLAGVAAVLILALALVWPQGLGARSPGPFRRPLGPVDPEVTAAQRAPRKPIRARYRPIPPVAPAGAPPASGPGAAPPLRGRGVEIPFPGGRP